METPLHEKATRGTSLREQLRTVFERFELQRVSGRIEKEQGRLLADFAGETNIGLDDELNLSSSEAGSEFVPFIPAKNHAEMRYRDVVSIHRVMVSVVRRDRFRRLPDRFRRLIVGDYLVPIKVEVDPLVTTSSLGATKDSAVKLACFCNVANRKSQMEWSCLRHA